MTHRAGGLLLRYCFLVAAVSACAAATTTGFARPVHGRADGRVHRHHGPSNKPARPELSASPSVQHPEGDAVRSGKQGPATSPLALEKPNGTAAPNAGARSAPGRDISSTDPAERLKGGVKATGSGGGASDPLGNTAKPEIHMRDLGPVDTRITVQPRLRGQTPQASGAVKDKSKPDRFKYLHSRPNWARRQTGRGAHNAIGVPVVEPHSPGPGSLPARSAVPGAASHQAPAPSAYPQPHPPIGTAPVAGRMSINGRGSERRGLAPAAIGGPKTTVTGISGSMVRPKR
jgi:hypothetical protein